MASVHYPGYMNEGSRSPIRRLDLRNQPYEAPQEMNGYPQEIDASESLSSSPFAALKYLYSLQEQLQGLENESSPLFKYDYYNNLVHKRRLLLKANYFVRNGVIFTEEDIDKVLLKKANARNVHRNELKLVAYQEVSDYLVFINHSNKIYLSKADSIGDASQCFDVKGIIQAIDLHPYKPLWMAIATKNDVKILYPLTDEDNILASIRSNDYKDLVPAHSKLEKYEGFNLDCTALEFSPDGRYLAMINEHSSTIHLWDFDSKRLRSHNEMGITFNKLKWSPDGAYLALSSDKAQKVYIMEVSTWQKQKWSLKAAVNQMSWSCDANTLYIFMKEILEIRAIRDVQLEKSKTAYERKEIEFRMADIYKLKLNDHRQLQSFTFCFEPNRLRYAYIASIDGREITNIGTIEETNDEKPCEIVQEKPPVKAFFFISKSGRPYEQRQPIIHKCYSKDEIESIKL